MKPFYLNTILPELYLNANLTKQFYLPFNVAGILILVEKKMYRPIWITTTLLELTKKEFLIDKKSIPKIDFLIKNTIVPNFTQENFIKYIDLAIKKGSELAADFSNLENWNDVNNSIELEYEPKFLPVYKKKNEVSHILFYLEPINEDKKFSFNQLEILIEEIDRVKSINKQLFSINKLPIVEINSYLKIENYNTSLEILFPKLKDSNKNNFLDIWSYRNQSKIAETLYRVKITQEEDLVVFEEMDNQLKKLRLKFQNIPNTDKSQSSILVSIENLNHENDKDKELTKKGFLLQSTQMLSYELEESETNFIKKFSNYIIQNFDFNGMYFLEFSQESKEKTIITFPKSKKEYINLDTYQSHELNFQPIIKRNVKHVLSKKVFNEGAEFEIQLLKSQYLLGIPIHDNELQTGVIVYLCDSKKIDIDSAYQLYSLTTIFYRIYNYQNKLSKIEVNA
jgi:hypothetical protein